MRFAFKLNLIFAFVLLLQTAGFAQTNTEAGVKLYQDGKYEAAVEALKKSAGGDGVAAYYLGLSYEKLGRTNEAVSSYKKSTDSAINLIRGDLVKKYWNRTPQEDIQPGENLPRDPRVKAAYESLSRLKEIDPGKAKNAEEWESLRFMMEPYVEAAPAAGGGIFTPVKIRMKPHPTYNDEARKNQVSGDVRVLVFFQANGKIGMVIPLKELPFGLTESSMRAARETTFVPASRDGKPVTVARVITYTFSIY